MRRNKHQKKRKTRNRSSTTSVPLRGIVAKRIGRRTDSDLTESALLQQMQTFGRQQEAEYRSLLKDLSERLTGIGPKATLGILAQYGLFGSIDEAGVRSGTVFGERFGQSHVEIAQAIALQVPYASSARPPDPYDIQWLFDALPRLTTAFHMRRFAGLSQSGSDQTHHKQRVQEWVRLHTQGIRHWTFRDRAVEILGALCRPIESEIRAALGASFDTCVEIFLYLVSSHDHRVTQRFQALKRANKAPRVDAMIDIFFEEFPEFDDLEEVTRNNARIGRWGHDRTMATLMHLSDQSIHLVFTHSPTEIADAINRPISEVTSALQRLSMARGELAGTDADTFFLNNPVWLKPIIRVDEDEYFCVLPQVFFSHSFQILKSLCSQTSTTSHQLSRRRSDYLEGEVSRLFSERFPEAEVARNYKWREGDRSYENDLLVRIDTHLLVIEAKSGAVTASALRGAPERMARQIEELLVDPSRQSERLATRIEQVLKRPAEQSMLLPDFPVKMEGLRYVLRLSVTLEDFATLQTSLHQLRDAGFVQSDHSIAPCISVADLQIVFDILPSQGHVLHYLRRRAELEATFHYHADELDLLAFYLKTAFAINTERLADGEFALLGWSAPIDDYYVTQQQTIPAKKPVPRMTAWWSRVCESLETRRRPGWSSIVATLLGIAFDEQRAIEDLIPRLVKSVRRNFKDEDHRCSQVIIPDHKWSCPVAVFVYCEVDRDRKLQRSYAIAEQAFSKCLAPHCVVIGINIDRQDSPYSFVLLVDRNTGE